MQGIKLVDIHDTAVYRLGLVPSLLTSKGQDGEILVAEKFMTEAIGVTQVVSLGVLTRCVTLVGLQ